MNECAMASSRSVGSALLINDHRERVEPMNDQRRWHRVSKRERRDPFRDLRIGLFRIAAVGPFVDILASLRIGRDAVRARTIRVPALLAESVGKISAIGLTALLGRRLTAEYREAARTAAGTGYTSSSVAADTNLCAKPGKATA